MSKRAKVFMTNRSQAVRLPKEFRLDSDEVFVRRDGEDLVLSPIPKGWDEYLDNGPVASQDFMTGVDDPPPLEREG